MSTVTFLPYIGSYFSKEYIIPNYIGESLSSLIPGLLAIIQGTNKDDHCNLFNNSISNYTLTTRKGPKYSVSVYFILMFSLLCISIIAFTVLNFSKRAIMARKSSNEQIDLCVMNNDCSNQILTNKNKALSENRTLFLVTFIGAFINYGYMPGLLSYSTIPYGNIYFHLSINLSNISNESTEFSTLF